MPRSKIITNTKKVFLSAVLCFFICTSATYALGRDSIIQVIQTSMPSIVGIRADNAKLTKSPKPVAVKDPKTGRIAIARGVRASTYSREGSGVIVDKSGLISTNAHTISGADRIIVTLHNKKEYEVKSASVVPGEDVAFLYINPSSDLTPIVFSNSDEIKIGDKAYTVGSSEFLEGTISAGRVTGLGRNKQLKNKTMAPVAIIQTSFNVYKGDSGGPLLDYQGKLLGLIVAGKTKTSHASFAIPSNKIKLYYDNLIKDKSK